MEMVCANSSTEPFPEDGSQSQSRSDPTALLRWAWPGLGAAMGGACDTENRSPPGWAKGLMDKQEGVNVSTIKTTSDPHPRLTAKLQFLFSFYNFRKKGKDLTFLHQKWGYPFGFIFKLLFKTCIGSAHNQWKPPVGKGHSPCSARRSCCSNMLSQ